jgi:uncharacterized protein (DUF1015 family)
VVPRFEPFQGLRYDSTLDLNRLVAPPYDVVGPEERAELALRHRANAIHVELPEADRQHSLNPYENAEKLLNEWRSEGLLRKDPSPSFYPYRMTPPGGHRPTVGVIGALGLEPPGDSVLPHEQTIPKDETDRLELLRATSANLSPIWGLSLTDGLSKLFEPDSAPTALATDDSGVLHELWVIDEEGALEAISLAVSASPVVLADGHHRYRTALKYRDEQRDSHDGVGGAYDLVMALIVELEEGGLEVGPIHRALSGTRGLEAVLATVRKWFDVVDAGKPDDAVLSAVTSSNALAMVADDGIWLLTPRPEAYEAANSDLDSSLVALVSDGLKGAQSMHFHKAGEAVDAVKRHDADVALLVRPVTVAQIRRWAGDRRLMPPKSTFFYPKPRTGMVYRSLRP